MKKSEQSLINNEILNFIEYYNDMDEKPIRSARLRTCSAVVTEYEHFYVLTSYRTNIAIIDKDTDTLYDVLRYVYEYTSTSAQHIAKFRHDYGRGKWGCIRELRYYPV